MAKIIVHDGKKKVVVRVNFALDRDTMMFAVLDGISCGETPRNKRECVEIAKRFLFRNGVQGGTSLSDDDYQKHKPEALAIVAKFFPELLAEARRTKKKK